MKQSMNRMEHALGHPKRDFMWKTFLVLTMNSLLCLGAHAAVDGAENTKAVADAIQSRTFNVRDYGAVGDDKTDNTDAFQRA